MSPECTVKIVIRDLPPRRARAAEAALGPDNVGFPDGLSMSVSISGGGGSGTDGRGGGASMTLLFRSRGGARIAALASTIDEVLSHVQVALGVTRG